MLIGIWLVLGLPLAILLITDIRSMYREEAEREAEEWRQYAEWTRSNGEGGTSQ